MISEIHATDPVVGERAQNIIKALLVFAHTCDLTVVAEGIEDNDQLTLLRDWHCDQLQGYHLALPLAPEQVLAALRGEAVRRSG